MAMMDVYFFVGKPTDNPPVYHVLMRTETYHRMEKDPNINFTNVQQANGTMEKDDLPPVKPLWFDGKPFCNDCVNLIPNIGCRPSYCNHCGRRFLYEDD